MITISIPDNIKPKRIENYISLHQKGLIDFIKLLYQLGGYMTNGQLIAYIKANNEHYSDNYCRKKSSEIIKTLKTNNVIEINNLNTNRYFCLKEFGVAIATARTESNTRINTKKNLKDAILKTKLMKVEYYLKNNDVISLGTMRNHLIAITNDIYKATINDKSLNYDKKLLKDILNTKCSDEVLERIKLLEDGHIIKIIWIDLKDIFYRLQLQGQTISNKPFYYRLFKKNGELTLHYVPEIIIFDTHGIEYYSKKVDILFNAFYKINGNVSEFTQKSYRENGNLGFEGYNKLAYTLKLIGDDLYVIKDKKKYLDSHIKDNPNAMMLTNVEIEFVDISRYLNHSSKNKEHYENIDNQITNLILSELKSQ